MKNVEPAVPGNATRSLELNIGNNCASYGNGTETVPYE
jgi:hypothetical protein